MGFFSDVFKAVDKWATTPSNINVLRNTCPECNGTGKCPACSEKSVKFRKRYRILLKSYGIVSLLAPMLIVLLIHYKIISRFSLPSDTSLIPVYLMASWVFTMAIYYFMAKIHCPLCQVSAGDIEKLGKCVKCDGRGYFERTVVTGGISIIDAYNSVRNKKSNVTKKNVLKRVSDAIVTSRHKYIMLSKQCGNIYDHVYDGRNHIYYQQCQLNNGQLVTLCLTFYNDNWHPIYRAKNIINAEKYTIYKKIIDEYIVKQNENRIENEFFIEIVDCDDEIRIDATSSLYCVKRILGIRDTTVEVHEIQSKIVELILFCENHGRNMMQLIGQKR